MDNLSKWLSNVIRLINTQDRCIELCVVLALYGINIDINKDGRETFISRVIE